MNRLRLVIAAALIFSIGWYTEFAGAEEHTSRPARKDEIVGYWQLIPLPESLRLKVFPTDPWPSPCQWFGYYNDGTLRTLDAFQGPCAELTDKKLSDAMKTVPAVISWEHYDPALVLVKRSDAKNYPETWEATMILKDFSREGSDFRSGDLVMYLRNFKEKKTLYVRHLRRLVSE